MKTPEQVAQGFIKGFERFADELGGDIKVDGMDFIDRCKDMLMLETTYTRTQRNEILDLTFKSMLEKGYFIIGGEA